MRIAVLFAAMLCAGSVQAQVYLPPPPGHTPPPTGEDGIGQGDVGDSGLRPYLEYKKHLEKAQGLSPLDNGLFGESTSLFNGATSFKVVDIDLAGNNSLPVQLARVLEIDIQPQSAPAYDTLLRGIGNWGVDVPHISATYPESSGTHALSCSGGLIPPATIYGQVFNRSDYWQGVSINVPGRGSTSLLRGTVEVPKPTTGASAALTTAERDFFDCIPMKSGLPGQGFRMTTASGLKYTFDVGVLRTASRLQGETWKRDYLTLEVRPVPLFVPRNKYYLLASKIEDPLGNTVNFDYNAAGHPTRIWSSDGREIVLTYTEGRLATAAADGRVWKYEYTPSQHFDTNPDLARVILPDASAWSYAYAGNLKPEAPPAHENLTSAWCRGLQAQVEQVFTLSATHPSGAKGEFNFENTRHYRSGVHATECWNISSPYHQAYTLATPYYFDVMSLNRKTISGPGVPAKVWSYDYGMVAELLWGAPNQAPVYPCATCTKEKRVTVTQPDGTKRRHRFGVLYRANEGRVLGEEVVDASGAVIRATTNEYLSDAQAPSQLFYAAYGNVLGPLTGPIHEVLRPVVSRTTIQQSRKFIWQVDMTCGPSGTAYCFDHLARPTKVIRSSAPTP